MKPRDLTDLLLLAAIWGASFLFMRMAVPAFGPVALAFVRVAGAALFLLPMLLLRGEAPVLRQRWRALLVLGLTNSALPFLLFGYAVYTLPAALAAIFNAATPLCTALIAWAWLGDPLNRWRSLGLALGFAGVAGLALVKSLTTPAGAGLAALRFDGPTLLAIGACLLGTLLYGYAGNHAKRHLTGVPAMAMAAGTQLAAALALAVPAALLWPVQPPGLRDWLAAAGLAVLASGLAYILYFRLITRVGPTGAASVTFLVPVFAALWGGLFLAEVPTLPMLAGGAVILAGTALVLGLWPRRPALRDKIAST
ncbi:DMT family transporter [Pseudaquabacterium pictum]|uniref:Multidrug DMT transporter permease n=1 Tax=Pseudaquabacterium pictum TaxID=2315236 RepID=A0A480AIF4_9BURK|nr:DMT family transporter [Rubrivivax pictus]GCL61424.1 multidrug DMT transporter permease [Rubrivivax pictus]